MGKRCLCIALVLILVTTIGLAPLAQPAEAVAGVVVAGAVVAVMAMAGITIITSGMTAAQIQDWVEDKLEEWADDVGSPLDHLINSAGIGVTISGLLTISTAAAQGISDFITWLKTQLSLTDNSTTNVVNSGGIFEYYTYQFSGTGSHSVSSNGVSITSTQNNTYGQVTYTAITSYSTVEIDFSAIVSHPNYSSVVVFQVPSGAWITASNLVNCTAYSDMVSCNTVGNYNASGKVTFHNASKIDVRVSSYAAVQLMFNSILVDGSPVSDSSLDLVTGVITIPNVQNDDKVFLDVGALPGSTAQEVTEGVFTDVAADTLDVSGEVAEEEPEFVITGPVSVSGLDDIFPFCIPFDLYHMCEALAADPVAPHFEWRFYVPRIVDYTIVIDLSGFNTVAEILRIMETLLFCVGLAFETRKLIRS